MAAPRYPRGRFLLLLLVLLGVTLVTLSGRSGNGGMFARARSYARQVIDPVQTAIHSALQPVGDFIYGAVEYRSLERQNQLLRQQLASEQSTFVQAASAQAEAQQVLAQEHLGYLGRIPSVAARVVNVGGSNFEQTVEVDRGSADGIVTGQPVVTAGGLIGSVSSVSRHLATVTLLDNPSFSVGVRDTKSGAVGVALGEGQGNDDQVINVNVGQQLKKGDYMVTSGLPLEHFPAGIPVGRVTSVLAPSGAFQLDVSMRPMADLVNLQFVRVLLWSPQTG